MTHAIIVGGGVIGLSLAYELSRNGLAVTLIDKGPLGREASWAGAGILPPGNVEKAKHPLDLLRAHSARLLEQWSAELRQSTGIDNGYVQCGGLELAVEPGDAPALRQAASLWRSEGIAVEEMTAAQLQAAEPALRPGVALAYCLPQQAQLRNPRHLRALAAGCSRQGVQFRTGVMATGFCRSGGRISAVQTVEGAIEGDLFVLASGAWSAALVSDLVTLRVRPVRGQIVLLSLPAPPLGHIVSEGPRYLVPRPDGRVLVGSTEEDAGFDTRNTPAGIHALLDFAFRLVPALRQAQFERAWAGLRPGSPDAMPYLGRAPGVDNLFLATGHHRSGLQLSAGTALVVGQLILGKPTSVPLDVFAPQRHAAVGSQDRVT